MTRAITTDLSMPRRWNLPFLLMPALHSPERRHWMGKVWKACASELCGRVAVWTLTFGCVGGCCCRRWWRLSTRGGVPRQERCSKLFVSAFDHSPVWASLILRWTWKTPWRACIPRFCNPHDLTKTGRFQLRPSGKPEH